MILEDFADHLIDTWDGERERAVRERLGRAADAARGGVVEQARGLLAADWLIRVYTPAWLRAAHLDEAAERVAGLPPVTDWSVLDDAALTLRAAERSADEAWHVAWEGAWAVDRSAPLPIGGPAAWDVARDAAWAAGGYAARSVVTAAVWDVERSVARDANVAVAWNATVDAAWSAAWIAVLPTAHSVDWFTDWFSASSAVGVAMDVARDALARTVNMLSDSAIELLDRMIEMQQESR